MPQKIDIRLPRLGWSMEEGTFVGWLKSPGDSVQTGEPLFTLENDKAAQDVEAIDSGVLEMCEQAPQAGQTLPVGALLGYLISESSTTNQQNSTAPQPQAPAASQPVTSLDTPVGSAAAQARTDRIIASPRARRLADQHGIELASISPSGTSGRIAEKDVQAALSHAGPRQVELPTGITAFRRTIAERMLASQQQTAPVTLVCTVDVANLVATRSQLKSKAAAEPVPSYTDIIMKHCARVLGMHPQLAVRWQGDQVISATSIDIGFAVDTDYGLAVPVVRGVDQLSLTEIAARSRELVTAAYDRRLKSQDVDGGVFTVTNLGAYGIDAFTPIINYPQCAILGLGAITRQPVVLRDGTLGVGWRMTLSLTFDHRIVDGAPAARFLQSLREFL